MSEPSDMMTNVSPTMFGQNALNILKNIAQIKQQCEDESSRSAGESNTEELSRPEEGEDHFDFTVYTRTVGFFDTMAVIESVDTFIVAFVTSFRESGNPATVYHLERHYEAFAGERQSEVISVLDLYRSEEIPEAMFSCLLACYFNVFIYSKQHELFCMIELKTTQHQVSSIEPFITNYSFLDELAFDFFMGANQSREIGLSIKEYIEERLGLSDYRLYTPSDVQEIRLFGVYLWNMQIMDYQNGKSDKDAKMFVSRFKQMYVEQLGYVLTSKLYFSIMVDE